MCLALPGKIVSIDEDVATVDYGTEQRKGAIVDGGYAVGDYVIIQGHIVIQKVPEQEVKQWLDLFK